MKGRLDSIRVGSDFMGGYFGPDQEKTMWDMEDLGVKEDMPESHQTPNRESTLQERLALM